MARHTASLDRMIHFYGSLLGLEVLGRFEDHNGYSGVFLGKDALGWHLEFTVSSHLPQHLPDPDDLLVFYTGTEREYREICQNAESMKLQELMPVNPYWKEVGRLFPDPDGFAVMICRPGVFGVKDEEV